MQNNLFSRIPGLTVKNSLLNIQEEITDYKMGVHTSSLDLVSGQAALADALAYEEPAKHLHPHHGVEDGLVDLEGVRKLIIGEIKDIDTNRP